MNKLKLVKLIVFFLSFLLIFGFLTAANIIYQKTQNSSSSDTTIIKQPQNSHIADYQATDKNIVLLIRGGNLPDRVISVDHKGHISANINLSWE